MLIVSLAPLTNTCNEGVSRLGRPKLMHEIMGLSKNECVSRLGRSKLMHAINGLSKIAMFAK